MVSGKYAALSGAIAREQAMETITNNLANLSTSGFKKDRTSFEAILQGTQQTGDAKGINYTRIRKIGTDFEQGALRVTGNDLDLAIEGEGFFKVQGPNNNYLTRQGHFKLDNNGMVKTVDGYNLLDDGGTPLQINEAQGKNITIDSDGNISVDGVVSGRVGVVRVAETDTLKKVGNSLFEAEQGTAEIPSEGGQVVQGSIELSNINMMEEMVLMTNTMRKFEVHHKVLKSYSTLGEKQDELGTVS